jgi:hypothetical protein
VTHVDDLRRGWSGPDAAEMAGITYRQLDYWARIGLCGPSLQQPHGSGTRRRYSSDDVRLLALLGQVPMDQRRKVVDAVRATGGTCRRFVLDSLTDAVYCCAVDEDVIAAIDACHQVTLIDLDRIVIPELDGVPA